jgi:hypothetical protein
MAEATTVASRTQIAAMAEEVATLLRHSNLDVRIYTWLSMAYDDLVSRSPQLLSTAGSIFSMNDAAVTNPTPMSPNRVDNPIGLIYLDGTNYYWFIPEYVPFPDMQRMWSGSYAGASAAAEIATGPRYWSWGPEIGDTTTNYGAIWFYPTRSVVGIFYVIQNLKGIAGAMPSVGQTFILPYAFENALIWGAAAIGAGALRPSLYPLYQGEYESAAKSLLDILSYGPDATPVMRSSSGPYAGSSRLMPPQMGTSVTP